MDEIPDDAYVVYKHQFHYLTYGVHFHYFVERFIIPQGSILVLFEISAQIGFNKVLAGRYGSFEYERFHYSAEERVMKKIPASQGGVNAKNRMWQINLGYTQVVPELINKLSKSQRFFSFFVEFFLRLYFCLFNSWHIDWQLRRDDADTIALGEPVDRSLHSKIDDIFYLNQTGCLLIDYLVNEKAYVRGFELFMAEEGNLTINVSERF